MNFNKSKKYIMKESIEKELINYGVDFMNEMQEVDLTDLHELHYTIFNDDYYIIGYYNAEQWCKKHNVNVFEALDYIRKNQMFHFGEDNTEILDYEKLVNHLVFWVSTELMEEIKSEYLNQFVK